MEESKGKRDRRTAPLSDLAFEICQRLALKHPEGPIFRDRRGKPWTATALNRECEKLSKLVGFHLRRTWSATPLPLAKFLPAWT